MEEGGSQQILKPENIEKRKKSSKRKKNLTFCYGMLILSILPLTIERRCFNCHRQTVRQTDGHGDSMTELAQWGRFRENGVETGLQKV